jgi:hypothetical protein
MTTNPDLLPKIRSVDLLDACRYMPCTLRIASFAGMRCAPQDTVVPCHLPTIGKGVSTKVSDLYVAAGCALCHDLVDGRDKRGFVIADTYPGAFAERLMRGNHETIARWVAMGLIEVKGGEIL